MDRAPPRLDLVVQIISTEQQNPDSVLIILGDFYKHNFSHELLKFNQHITCHTRDVNTLEHCYTIINNTPRSVPWAPVEQSDHNLVHLIPT